MDEATAKKILIEASDKVRRLISKHYKKLSDDELKKMYILFIKNSPTKEGAENSKKFSDYGLNERNDFRRFKSKFLNKLSMLREDYKCFTSKSDFANETEQVYKFVEVSKAPIFYFYKGQNSSRFDSLFTHLRNSIAHSKLAKKENGKTTNYIFWDGKEFEETVPTKTKNKSKSPKKQKRRTITKYELRSVIILNNKHIDGIFEALKEFKDQWFNLIGFILIKKSTNFITKSYITKKCRY